MWAGELTHTKKNGEQVAVETRMRRIDEAGGRLVLEVNRDVSQRKRAEQEIRRLNENLERLVRERTAQLEEVVQSLQAFSYSVSHDLRAPLRNVQTLAQAMLEDYGDRLDELGRDYAQRLIASARRMDALIRDLLSYSRLTRADLSPQQVSLASAVSEALRELHAEVAERGADVRVDGPLPAVVAHRTTLVQVLKNLLANALKFVEPGVPPRVRVWAEGRGEWVRLWVEDNGIGIAEGHRERIFAVFERLHGEESYPGTGIGLAIVQKGVERMGGRCGVESEVGRGSRFWVELPKAEGGA
jgi:signal transduction histidine kinase